MGTQGTAQEMMPGSGNGDAVVAFWSWFNAHRARMQELVKGDRSLLPLYDEMTRRMQLFDPLIYPELTMDDKGYVLIVTADGRSEGIDPVMRFTEMYPVVEGWRVQRFRKPVNDPLAVFEYQDLICALEEVRVAYAIDEVEQKVHIGMVIEGASREDERWMGMLYLLLDHAIGEFNSMTRVGGLDLMSLEDLPADVSLISLDRLREVIETEFYS